MIVSFRDDWLRDFFVKDIRSKRIPAALELRFLSQDPVDRRRYQRSGFEGPAQQSFREVARQSRGVAFDLRQPTVAARLSLDGGRGEATGVYLDNHSDL